MAGKGFYIYKGNLVNQYYNLLNFSKLLRNENCDFFSSKNKIYILNDKEKKYEIKKNISI